MRVTRAVRFEVLATSETDCLKTTTSTRLLERAVTTPELNDPATRTKVRCSEESVFQ